MSPTVSFLVLVGVAWGLDTVLRRLGRRWKWLEWTARARPADQPIESQHFYAFTFTDDAGPRCVVYHVGSARPLQVHEAKHIASAHAERLVSAGQMCRPRVDHADEWNERRGDWLVKEWVANAVHREGHGLTITVWP